MRRAVFMWAVVGVLGCGDDSDSEGTAAVPGPGVQLQPGAPGATTGLVDPNTGAMIPAGQGTTPNGTATPMGMGTQTGMGSNTGVMGEGMAEVIPTPGADCREPGSECGAGFECRQNENNEWVCAEPSQPGTPTPAGPTAPAPGGPAEVQPLAGGQQCGIVSRPQPRQSGVAYVAALFTSALQWFRIDGASPTLGGEMNVSAPVLDMVMDEDLGLLVTLHFEEKTAVVYKIARPTAAGMPVAPPRELGRIQYTHLPVVAAMDRIRGRLYTLTMPPLPDGGGPVTYMELTIHDLSNPETAIVAQQSVTVPTATSMGIDAQRGLLFLHANIAENLLAYDVTGPVPASISAMTLDLNITFPETNTTGFRLRNFRVDEEEGRLYVARAQGSNSQASALEYIPAKEAVGGCVNVGAPTVLRDNLDLATEPAQRTNLLDGFVVEPIRGMDGAFFLANAWNGTQSYAILATLDQSLTYQPGCGEFVTDVDMPDFGCFLRKHLSGTATPSGYVVTEGALCVDSEHRVVVATSVDDPNDEFTHGAMHFYEFRTGLPGLGRWLPSDGTNLRFPGLAVVALCH